MLIVEIIKNASKVNFTKEESETLNLLDVEAYQREGKRIVIENGRPVRYETEIGRFKLSKRKSTPCMTH